MAEALLLYDHPVSSNALKARFLLAELGLAYDTKHVPFAEPRPDWYTAVNPFGRIPTLVDGGFVLPESNAILRYLAQREERYDLYPLEPRERARVDVALDAWSTQIRPQFFGLERVAILHRDLETGGGTWEEADPAAIEAARGPVEAALDKWERFIADNGTVLGSFGIADCCAGPVLWRTLRLPLDLERWPKAARLREAITARASFQAAGPVG